MILLLAAALGLVVGMVLAVWRGRSYQISGLRFTWLSIGAFLPQVIAFYFPPTRSIISRDLAAASLIGSQALLLVFTWLNRKIPGMLVLALGLVLNLAVISVNGGLMPISPETVENALPVTQTYELIPGERFGAKDVLIAKQDMKLELLSDRSLLPVWFPFQAIYSIGDAFIALGIFWLLVQPGSRTNTFTKELQPS